MGLSSRVATFSKMSSSLRLLSIHAHPDDESSKGAATVAKYSDAGAFCTLLCCTGGEEGDVLNEAMQRPEIIENLAEVRRQELINAADIIGYDKVIWLGYRDSGMKDSDANHHDESFARAPFDEAVSRVAQVIRDERPHVVLSYAPARGGYDHPDHERVHEVTEPAIALAADPDADLDGEPWQVLKLYFSAWSRARLLALHHKFEELGLESPFDERWFDRPDNDHFITTRVPIEGWYDRRSEALRAHQTQIDPNASFWFGLPDDDACAAYPFEDYERVWSRVPVPDEEDDLFDGLLVGAES